MRNKIYSLLVLVAFSMLSGTAIFAQTPIEPESFMRSNSKIYVVCAICLTILTGLFLYVASIDKKIGKIEKENRETTN